MKISRMQLVAFGPFTKSSLDFSRGDTDFHMVYGPNEAGKSCALSAFRYMLFGIPVRTSYSFLHPNPSLRIGARLVKGDGTEIEFIRRKGNVKTLRGSDDETVLDEETLVSFLGGVGQDHFKQMFAIGHDDLIAGGQEIVTGGGSVGQALFAAGAGLVRLQSLQKKLEQVCEDLFKPSGSKPHINSTLSSLKIARKSQKDALLPGKTWKLHHKNLHDAKHKLGQLQQKSGQLKQESNKLERIWKALPMIARKKEIEKELPDYNGVPELPEDFGDRRRAIENDLKIATNDFDRICATIQVLQEQIDALSIPAGLLQHETSIEELQQELGACRKGRKDRPDREGMMRALKKQASDKLAAIRSTALSDRGKSLKLPPSVVGEIQDMGIRFERLTTRLDTAREQYRKIETQISTLSDQKKGLASPSDMASLIIALQTAQDAGPLEKQISQTQAERESRKQSLNIAIKQLPIWSGSLENIDALPFPSKESVDRFETQFSHFSHAQDKLEENRQTIEKEMFQIEADLNAIALSHDVPTETDLETARIIRENGWGLIREKLEGGEPPLEEIDTFAKQIGNSSNLPDAFEISVEEADNIADRLRREAEQVSKKGMLEARKHLCQKNKKLHDEKFKTSKAKQTEIREAWQKLWEPSGIQPLSPKEMHAWLSEVSAIRDKLADLRSEQARIDGMNSEAGMLKTRITQDLKETGYPIDKNLSLLQLIGVAKTHVDSNESLKMQITSIDKEHIGQLNEKKDIKATIANIESDLEQWKIRWGKNVEKIGLDAEVSPAAAMVVIDSIREAKVLMDEADVLRKRIEGIDRDTDAFRKQVNYLVDNVASDLKDEMPERAAELLNARLTLARESQSKRKSLDKQIIKTTEERQVAQKRIADTSTLMESICHEARCKSAEDLEQVEKRSNIRRQKVKDLEEIEARIRDLSAGATVAEFIADASTIEADSVSPELERLESDIKALESERSELDQAIGTENAELKRMDGSAEAAGHAEKAERLMASLESDVETYARMKIASVILARTIEQYREKHQGPLIQRASELFSQMTIGSFSGVRADYDDKGTPILVGIRPESGQPVMVTGMSDGTADQLYLALRLASLEQFLENNEPLPFVVDDILLRFDDKRALATLEVLAYLSEKTQVIFFTHHRHLLDLAHGGMKKALSLTVHNMG
ncbi:MAG: hypothetical protein DRI24_02095 [Deltaproteobacteria bacterium]|nr:MAG: hypothetical protein DRI24_02095 [Deltaproteobacteria bacterium]